MHTATRALLTRTIPHSTSTLVRRSTVVVAVAAVVLAASGARGDVVLDWRAYSVSNSDGFGSDYKQQDNNTTVSTSVTGAGRLADGAYLVDTRGTATFSPSPSNFTLFQFQASSTTSLLTNITV